MDIQKQFKDLNLDDKNNDTDEGDKIIKDLEARLKKIKETDEPVKKDLNSEFVKIPENLGHDNTPTDEPIPEGYPTEEEVTTEDKEQTLLEKLQPFILPICLTLFAVLFAAIFLYFFSRGNQQPSVPAITNTGNIEAAYVPPVAPVVKPIIIPETLTCTPPQILNDTGDTCIDEPPVEVATPTLPSFENGTTAVVSVRFSYDKFNYDTYPRGIYLNADQIFEGDYADFKILPTNKAFANDDFFGVDRYVVSLIGTCEYVVDSAHILVSNMKDSTGDQVYSAIKDKYFRGRVEKVLDASKPHIVCGAKQYQDPAADGFGTGDNSTDSNSD